MSKSQPGSAPADQETVAGDGTQPDGQEPEKVRKQFGKYRLIRLPGEGEMEAVDPAQDSEPGRNVASMSHRLVQALVCAHEHGVILRDLKPGNVMINISPQPSPGQQNRTGLHETQACSWIF